MKKSLQQLGLALVASVSLFNVNTLAQAPAATAAPAAAQSASTGAVKVQKAELAINFGVAKGELVTANDLLIFVDQEVADGSFLIERANMSAWTEMDGVVNIVTAKPVKGRSGESNRFAFRLLEGTSVNLANWYRETANRVPAAAPAGEAAKAGEATKAGDEKANQKVYSARQKRFPVGSSDGRLVMTDKMVAFEANGDTKRSRIWDLKDIKKLEQVGPYRLKIEPFMGDSYTFDLLGEGMTPGDFKALQDKVANARLKQ